MRPRIGMPCSRSAPRQADAIERVEAPRRQREVDRPALVLGASAQVVAPFVQRDVLARFVQSHCGERAGQARRRR